MKSTPIPDKEAALLIGVSKGTIRNAVKRGDLTRVPMTGQVQHVIKEQVLLFSGRKQLIHLSLGREELQQWEELAATVISKESPDVSTHHEIPTQAEPILPGVKELVSTALGGAKMYERGEINANEYAKTLIAASGTVIHSNGIKFSA